MATEKQIKSALARWVKLLEDPEIAEEFDDYNKTLQFEFPDMGLKLQLVIENCKGKILDGENKKAEMGLTINSDLFMGIATGAEDPMELFMNGEFKIKGNMSDLERLRIFMDEG